VSVYAGPFHLCAQLVHAQGALVAVHGAVDVRVAVVRIFAHCQADHGVLRLGAAELQRDVAWSEHPGVCTAVPAIAAAVLDDLPIVCRTEALQPLPDHLLREDDLAVVPSCRQDTPPAGVVDGEVRYHVTSQCVGTRPEELALEHVLHSRARALDLDLVGLLVPRHRRERPVRAALVAAQVALVAVHGAVDVRVAVV